MVSKKITVSKSKTAAKVHTPVTSSKYGLYHTLNKDTKKKDLTTAQKKKLIAKIGEMDEQRRIAVMMLIFEHATRDNIKMTQGNKVKLPYGMKQSASDVVIDIEEMPVELRIILWKFSQVA